MGEASPPAALSAGVALCTYNGARHLAEQFESILAQNRMPDEIVVSDDGSTDGTVELIREFLHRAAERGIAVRYLGDGVRRGVTPNFALAIASCGSDVIVLSDQDDVWHADRLGVALESFERDPGLLLRHENARLVDERGQALGRTLFDALAVPPEDRSRINRGQGFGAYLRRNIATGATMSFRRVLYPLAAPLPEEWVHDEWLAIVAAAVGRVEVTDNCLVDYRQHGTNVIGAPARTLRYRMARMLETSQARNAGLAARSVVLADRLGAIDTVSDQVRAAARAKAQFEFERAALPAARIGRIRGVLRASRGGRYSHFASQGMLDMLRDVLQRAA